jgi:hypothetical protein
MNFGVILTRPQKQPKKRSPNLFFAANQPDAQGFLRANSKSGRRCESIGWSPEFDREKNLKENCDFP